jgi:hypothetical protein
MKIKIPPYPNYKITEQAFSRDIVSNSIQKSDSTGLSNQLVIITEFKTGEPRVMKSRPVKYLNQLFVTAFPNPVHLFLSVAIEHYNHSEKIKEINFPKCGKKIEEDIFILDIEENGTHDCYNHYIKYRASSIIMLVSALEAFLNHIIPNDFIYRTIRRNKPVEFNKEKIESPEISFREKLTDVIPQWLGDNSFWNRNLTDKENILELYENRRKIIHLKTNSQDDFQRYFSVIDKMLDLDISTSVNSTIKFMNLTTTNFVEIVNETKI